MNQIGKGRYYNRRRSPEAAKQILRAVLGQYGLDKKLERYEFIFRWREIVGDEIAERTIPEAIQGSVLVVRVESSAWAQELSFQKNIILKRYKAAYKDDVLQKQYPIRDIRFYVGRTTTTTIKRPPR